MTSTMAMRRWLSAVVRMRCTPLRRDEHRRRVAGRDVIDHLIEVEGACCDGVRV